MSGTPLLALASALDPAGRAADRIAELWWVLLVATTVPFVLVVTLLVAGLLRGRGEGERPPALGRLSDVQLVLAGGVGLPLLVLVPVIATMIGVGRSLEGASAEPEGGALTVAVQGRQFWWDVTYLPSEGGPDVAFRTANEIHVPVGRPVELRLRSDDVIHSFWVPSLHGKIDLIPGRVNQLTIQADRPGEYVGRCAELCGLSHALMRLVVVAHAEDEFEAWLRRESGPASDEALAGIDQATRQEFANSCGPCHTVRGMFEQADPFTGTLGPDLTHLAVRRKVANVLPVTREALGRWIVDPDGVKPGTLMPDTGVGGEQLGEIVDFLLELE